MSFDICHDQLEPDPMLFHCSTCGLMMGVKGEGEYEYYMWLAINDPLKKPRFCPNCGKQVIYKELEP